MPAVVLPPEEPDARAEQREPEHLRRARATVVAAAPKRRVEVRAHDHRR